MYIFLNWLMIGSKIKLQFLFVENNLIVKKKKGLTDELFINV